MFTSQMHVGESLMRTGAQLSYYRIHPSKDVRNFSNTRQLLTVAVTFYQYNQENKIEKKEQIS